MTVTKKISLALLALGACLATAQAPTASAASPAWQLSGVALPSNFAPGSVSDLSAGPEYFLVATNVGAAEAEAPDPIVIEATLPDGVVALKTFGPDNDPESPDPTCEDPPVGPTIVCETTGPLHPGRWLGLRIPVEVEADAEGSLELEATVSGGGAGPASASVAAEATAATPSFGFLPGAAGFGTYFTDADGLPVTGAGSHPHQLTVNLGFTVKKPGGVLIPAEQLSDLRLKLPRGVLANLTATPRLCTEAELTSEGSPGCPDGSQVGTISVMTVGPANTTAPLFNMVPPPGMPGQLGFNVAGVGVFAHVVGEVRSDEDYGLSGVTNDLFAPSNAPVLSTQAQLWGDPSDPSHDQVRGACKTAGGSCPVDETETALLTMPTGCTAGSIASVAHGAGWLNPGAFLLQRTAQSQSLGGAPAGVDGCGLLEFEPTFEPVPSTNVADSPTGLEFKLHQPQNFDLEDELGNEERSTAALKDAVVTLPEGMVVNPSQADGLDVCTKEQIGLLTPVGQTPIRLSKQPDSCPDAAKIGRVKVSSPVLAEIDDTTNEVQFDPETGVAIPRTLEGDVFVAKPFDNPFGSLLAIYFSVEDPKSGIVGKLAGKVEPDPVTGQLRTRFEENPQLPLEDIELQIFDGPRAPLITPPTCGTHTTTSVFTPWSSPEGADAVPSGFFDTTSAPGGGPCPSSAAAAPHAPTFTAGTLFPQAGAHATYATKLAREDGSQRVKGLNITLPPGLTGKVAGIPLCSDAQIAQAEGRSQPNEGALEQASPSCPAASRVGTVTVGAGAGSSPFHTQGTAYLAGPYKGGPRSLAIVTPAVAGPFDLGVVVVRVALYVDPVTAQISAVSDPVPTILQGIPLDVRSAAVRMDRPNLTLNPTSCDPMSVEGEAISVFGQVAALADRFQVGGCKALRFAPRLNLRLFGGTERGDHPRLRAVLRPRPGDANIARTTTALPRSAFLDQSHIRTVCTRVQFAAKACPKGAIYGRVRAITPLLDEPLSGPVYLRSSDNELPDMVAVLRGPASLPVEIETAARIDSIRGGIRANFESIPDAPISKVILTMQGGRKGLLINSRNLCTRRHRATVKMDAHNGRTHDFRPVVRASCGKAARERSRRGSHGKR
jgi:hypothetical protein